MPGALVSGMRNVLKFEEHEWMAWRVCVGCENTSLPPTCAAVWRNNHQTQICLSFLLGGGVYMRFVRDVCS
jgi:hypothetical protein